MDKIPLHRKVSCPKCGATVEAEILERRRRRYEKYGKRMSLVGNSFETLEDQPLMYGGMACGTCMTKRKK